MKIYESVTDMIGHTPLLHAARFGKERGALSRILVKIEGKNPAGSAKDRVAAEMIAAAEAEGRLQPGGTVIEPTSGNTGIGLAAVCAAKGYRLVITMPDSMSVERRKAMTAFGAELVLTDGKLGMTGAIEKAEELLKATPGAVLAGQFTNPANPAAHYKTTGPEIFEDTEGKVDFFVAGAGTGGTISGTGKFLKERTSVTVVAVEPENSAVLSGKSAGPHKLQGIGAGFVPKTLDLSVIDEVIPVSAAAAYEAARLFARTEGILVGISGGAALSAGIEIARRKENAGKTVVVLLPDTGDRYLSTDLFF